MVGSCQHPHHPQPDVAAQLTPAAVHPVRQLEHTVAPSASPPARYIARMSNGAESAIAAVVSAPVRRTALPSCESRAEDMHAGTIVEPPSICGTVGSPLNGAGLVVASPGPARLEV